MLNIKIEKQELVSALNPMGNAVAKTDAIPALKGVVIKAAERGLGLTASNNDLTMNSFIPCVVQSEGGSFEQVEVFGEGKILIAYNELTKILSKCKTAFVFIEEEEKEIIIRDEKRYESRFAKLNVTDFPIPKVEQAKAIKLFRRDLLSLLDSSFACAVNETRPILTGAQFLFTEECISVHSTDSHRLFGDKASIIEIQEVDESKNEDDLKHRSVVVPRSGLEAFAKALHTMNNDIATLKVTENHFTVTCGTMQISSRLLTGTYPDVERIVPSSHTIQVTFDTEELYDSMDQMLPAATENKHKVVRMTLNAEELKIESKNKGVLVTKSYCAPQSYEGDESLVIGGNVKYMMDALKKVKGSSVTFEFNGPMNPFILRGSEDEERLQIILPVRQYE